ncbi:hypothetical protein KL86PLE_60011 [uncultured Pleomorphomonas sp.]|uniref:Uncharacterized protein n=1 Tax=uncultured Pleomorphomonas sp. TaxID=442121 RepID=A0A212LJF9_9HYPH|nr:hypothetical protein KL86PLE_60011 [uncultured Pleomorphomonas sp.]
MGADALFLSAEAGMLPLLPGMNPADPRRAGAKEERT